MIYKSDLQVALNGTQRVWVGGVDVIPTEGALPVARFLFDTVDYNYIYEGKAIKEMTAEEFSKYLNLLKEKKIKDNSQFITEYQCSIDNGSYRQETE